ncbi:CTLH domain-containing protein [Mycena venus]|uniref:CTLH domain-containing protein n=1 Tax=Mycena venus TaxID=2733690 RepID=A0A8H7CQT3_9AGAR|nr:CTLH domain-containing protein [Mycena venus]
MKYGVGLTNAVVELDNDTERRHQELLELLSRSELCDDASSMSRSSLNASSGSLSLLPASPKIFCGRDAELADLVHILLANSPRVAILGPGGMGKTTLAMAALHHLSVVERYPERHFISCESANTFGDLVVNIALHLGPELSRQPKAIVRHFQKCGPCVVVLDNFETPWEPVESRAEVEELLSLLADIPSLALLVTMRGAERPTKVKWSRPFLAPLEPLSSSASREIFLAISDEPGSEEESAFDELLDLSDSLPLAVALMAYIASFEGYSATLSRWKIENTALLSGGHDKRSNLEKSIALSFNSPRMSSSLNAKNLLALLSLLPDGIRVEDLMESRVPILNVRQCQSLLVGTSLAYVDINGRLKALSPIREYIRRVYAPAPTFSTPLRTYFQDLLGLWQSRHHIPSGYLAPKLTTYLGNITQLLLHGLSADEKSAWIGIGDSIIILHKFSRMVLKGDSLLVQRIPDIIQTTGDAGLRWKYAAICLKPGPLLPADPDALVEEGARYFGAMTSTVQVGEAVAFYNAVARHYSNGSSKNLPKAMEFNQLSLALARQADDIELQLSALATECYIAFTSHAPSHLIEVAHEGMKIGGLVSNPWAWEFYWMEAWALSTMGNPTKALELCTEADEWLSSVGLEISDRYLALVDVRADAHLQKGEYLEARQLYEQMVKKTSPTRSAFFHAFCLIGIAKLDMVIGRPVTEVAANVNAAEAVYTALGMPTMVTLSYAKAELQLYRGEIETARWAFSNCLAKTRGVHPPMAAMCLAALSDPRKGLHTALDAFPWAVIYLAFAQKTQDPIATVHALRRIADTLLDDEGSALTLFGVALEAGTAMDIHDLQAECMAGIGDIMDRRGGLIQARDIWERARLLFVRSSRKKEATGVQKRLDGSNSCR